jgi:hypothetical protein
MKYLRCIINTQGTKIDPKKIEAILALERPQTAKDAVRWLLGMEKMQSCITPSNRSGWRKEVQEEDNQLD